ncbi:hypothetical protein [Sphingomonas asaccharolytica]|uniref:hypothetical protein n=1 Tax=Sphingomonas asaccharolytica TaxID=40681 RepID=UPI00082F287C|nr:hypothetical protein [Sphingomonas asaccharolytica]
MTGIDWETWLLEDAGHPIIEKMTERGIDALSPVERLTYCMWVADYGMRNGGDLETAADLYPQFKSEAAEIAADLRLQKTTEVFDLTDSELATVYFDRFDELCTEISEALGVPPQIN